jgi:hypothetical protein
METLKTINDRLQEYYGSDITGKFPIYRVVWSDSQYELRKAEVNVFLAKVFLRTDNGVQLLSKYPYLKGKHVFEAFTPTDNPELVEGYKNYEPVYVFQDKYGDSLPVVWWACEFVATAHRDNSAPKITFTEEDEKLKEYKEYFEVLDEAVPEVPARIKRGSGIVITDTEYWK